jgi:radical SAM protein with 4Fe4S-binding SPASM domain
MSLAFFEDIIQEAKQFTNEIACHVMGDPLTLSNLSEYLDILYRHQMRAILTTSGYFVAKQREKSLFHPAIKQINISLNAFNKNDTSLSFEEYMEPILALCHAKIEQKVESFINLRLWNLDEAMSEKQFNRMLFMLLAQRFDVALDLTKINPKKSKSIRLGYKVLLHFDNYFEWPSLKNPKYGHGTCQGLHSHIGILANGDVIPCCLDGEAVMRLGNLKEQSLQRILDSQRAIDMREGFAQDYCSEELCLRCSYKERFNSSSVLKELL